jgi:pimeloyl-ACP methyl ester carboxylesterase
MTVVPPATTTNRIEVDGPLSGHSVVIDEHGTATGMPVVLLHGELGAFEQLPLGAGVSDECRILAVHLPGWGVSQGGDRFANLGELATALWWALDSIGVGAAVVAGHGVGATAGVEMAIQQPGRVIGLCLAAPYGLFRTDDPGVDLFGTLPKELMRSLYEDAEGPVAQAHFPAPADAHERGLASIRRVVVLGAASRYLFPIPDTGVSDRLYRLGPVPVVALFGGADRLVPAGLSEDWAALLPKAEVRVLEGATHMHPYERPDFSAAVTSLVAGAAVGR